MFDVARPERVVSEPRDAWVQVPDQTFMGFILDVRPTFLLLQRFRDFDPNGFALLPTTTDDDG